MTSAGEQPAAIGEASTSAQLRMAFILRMRERGIADLNLLRALETVPRESFVPRRYSDLAWRDISLPIACGQIMPDPFAVARTIEALALTKEHRVLEIGAGSGYSTAILAQLAGQVVSYERYQTLAVEAQGRLAAAGCTNVELHCGDGFAALTDTDPSAEKFDRILVHLALEDVPQSILLSLNTSGRIVFARQAGLDQQAGLYLRIAGGGSGADKFVAAARLSPPLSGVSEAL